jgi:uncharacterized protein (TIGR01777 family)
MGDKIVIAGGSGFIGSLLVNFFLNQGWEVVVLTRNIKDHKPRPGLRLVKWDGKTLTGWEAKLSGSRAVLNLAGEDIGKGRWDARKKNRILSSRIEPVRALTKAFQTIKKQGKPRVFIQASAIGYYGDGEDRILIETSAAGQGFLARVVREWETAAGGVREQGVRTVMVRMGLVLSKNGGVLPRFVLPFRFFLGGTLGNGKQWYSWIHMEDVARSFAFLATKEECRGAYNLAAPNPLTQREFARILGQVLRRPALFPAPAWGLRLFLGEKARELLLSSQRVLPEKLLKSGFTFRYPDLLPALTHLLK